MSKNKVKPLLCILLFAISVCVLYSLFYYKNGFTGFADKTGVDVAYYINLEHRLDRKEEILEEMSRIRFPMEKVERIDAIYDKDRGHLGCSKSHIKTLERFIASGNSNCIVLEDDFVFVNPDEAIAKINNVFDKQIPFDVIMLSAAWVTSEPSQYDGLEKINYAQTASGYMVSKAFAPRLLENFKEGCELLEKSYNDNAMEGRYAIDQYWGSLMPDSKWYAFDPLLGKQRASYSDIMGSSVDYGV